MLFLGCMGIGLNKRTRDFCAEYIKDLNGQRAAIAVGYPEKSAGKSAMCMLAKRDVQNYIADLRQAVVDKKDAAITLERVLAEYGKNAYFDIRTIYTDSNALKTIHQFDDAAAAAVAGIDSIEEFGGRGEDREQVGTVRKVKLADKVRALDSICKVMGWNAPEKRELTGKDGEPLMPKPDLSKLSKDELKAMVEISKKLGVNVEHL